MRLVALTSSMMVCLLAALPASAMAPCRPGAEAAAIYPAHAAKAVPRDVVVFLNNTGGAKPAVTLVRLPSARPVAAKLLGDESWSLVRLVPSRPLRPGATYEVRLSSRRAPRPGTVVLSRFRVGRQRAGKALPAFGRINAEFGAPASSPKRRRPGWVGIRRRGRSGWLTLPAKSPIKVVSIRVSYETKQGPRQATVAAAYKKTVYFGYNHPTCPRPGRVTSAPSSGRYRLEAIPWSASGRPGKPVVLTGKITTAPGQ